MECGFGHQLNHLFQRVDQAIRQGAEQPDLAIEEKIETAQEITFAIDHTKNAYKDYLDYTIDKMGSAAQTVFEKLKGMVENFEKGEAERKSLRDQAQQLVKELPLGYYQPRLSQIQPCHLLIGDTARNSLVTFIGSFPSSFTEGSEPIFTLNNRSCRLISKDKQSISFEIPSEILQQKPNFYSYQLGHLVMPWDSGWLRSCKVQEEYNICLGTLPSKAGVATVEYISTGKVAEKQKKTTDPESFTATKSQKVFYHSFFPDPDYLIDTTQKPSLLVDAITGKHSEKIVFVSPEEIKVEINLNYHRNSSSNGQARACVSFTQFQMKDMTNKRTEEIELEWNKPIQIQPKEGEIFSKASFKDYKGATAEYQDAQSALNLDHVFQLSQEDGVWKIWAEKSAPSVEKTSQEEAPSPVEAVSEENASSTSYTQSIQESLYQLFGQIKLWGSSSEAQSEQSATLLQQAEALQTSVMLSQITPEEAQKQIEDLSASVSQLGKKTQEI